MAVTNPSPMLLSAYDPATFKAHPYLYVSEKYDGWRLYFRNGTFYTRSGNPLALPEDFATALNKHKDLEFDGELWMGYGTTSSDVTSFNPATVQYMIFDVPNAAKTFEERLAILRTLRFDHPRIHPVEHKECQNAETMDLLYKEVLDRKGEGIVLRTPTQIYNHGTRDDEFMKKKPNETMEVIIQDYHTSDPLKFPEGYVSSLYVMSLDGGAHEFKVNFKGFNPPAKGTIATIRYTQRTSTGLPKFPVLLYERAGADLPADVKMAAAMNPKPNKKPKTGFKHTLAEIGRLQMHRLCEGVCTMYDARPLEKGNHCYVDNGRGSFYKVSRSRDGAVYYCSCEAWRFQYLAPVFRTCKHCIAVGNFKPVVRPKLLELAAAKKAMKAQKA